MNNDLTALSHGATARPGSALDGYIGADGSQHSELIDAHGHVHELYAGAAWENNDLTAWAGGATAALGSALAGYIGGKDGFQHLIFMDAHGHVHELTPGTAWQNHDLTAWTGGPTAAPGSHLDGFSGPDGSNHVHLIDTKGHLHELWSGAAWQSNDLTVWTGGATAAPGSALDGYAGTT